MSIGSLPEFMNFNFFLGLDQFSCKCEVWLRFWGPSTQQVSRDSPVGRFIGVIPSFFSDVFS